MHSKARRLRRIARVLAVIWAAGWTLMWSGLLLPLLFVVVIFPADGGNAPRAQEPWFWLWLFLPLVAWVPTAVAWRWQAIGGGMLVVVGLLMSLAFGLVALDYLAFIAQGGPVSLWTDASSLRLAVALLLIAAALPFAAGSLFLASRRRSRSTDIRPGPQRERG
jgi:hypothetical protein